MANSRWPWERSRRAAGTGLGLLVLLAACGCGGPPERVVLITIDTLRADHVGAYGAGPDATPFLDQVAAQGVRFETAISPVPLTLPSHASILTGRDPLEHGVHHNASFRLDEAIPVLTEQLHQAGFTTAAFVGALVLDRDFGLARGFDVYDDRMRGRHAAGNGGWAERPADEVVDAALAWLANAPERFFLWVHLYDPHAFHQPPPRFAGRPSPYAGEVAFADEQVGRLLVAMGERFDLSLSLIAITSDHGESLGEHMENAHGFGLYDATQRVPLILAGRGVPVGRVVREPVRLADVAPTLLALAGLPPLPGAIGVDLTPLLGGTGEAPPPAYLETFAPRLDASMSPLLAIRTERYKYIEAPTPELYDLKEDPREERDLLASRPKLAARLRRKLERRIEGAPPVRPNFVLEDLPRAMLESLGYVAAPPPEEPIPIRVEDGPEPKTQQEALKRYHDADLLMLLGRAPEAQALLEKTQGGGFHGGTERAQGALAAGDLQAAEREARAAIEGNPARGDGYFLLGEALAAQGRLEEARAAYGRSLHLQPERGLTWERLGRLAERQGHVDEALELYRRALSVRDPAPEAAARQEALLGAPGAGRTSGGPPGR